MKKIIYLSILIIAASACKPKVITEYKEVAALRASNIYSADSVYLYMGANKDGNKEISDSYLKRSKEEEETNLTMSLYYCKRAITLHPTLDNYKTLAGLLNKTKDYQELNRLYYLLVNKASIKMGENKWTELYPFGTPDQDTYSEYMVCELLSSNYLYGEIVYQARELGFNIPQLKEKVFSDKRLHIDMTTPDAKNMMLLFLSEDELAAYNKLESTFKDFLASIKDVSPVFEINTENVRKFNYEDFNGMNDYDEFEGPTTSIVYTNYLEEKKDDPDGWYRYNFNHIIDINDSIKAVVYAIDTSETACPIDMRHIYHRLITYDKKSNIIDSKVIALQSGPQLLTANVNFNKFTTTEYTRSWKKPYDKKDFDNYLESISEKGKQTSYEILPNGKIREAGAVASTN